MWVLVSSTSKSNGKNNQDKMNAINSNAIVTIKNKNKNVIFLYIFMVLASSEALILGNSWLIIK